ncbi:MAG: EAL domain-containing protein [Lachnospiraceae bacterium]|nr:EAL domain-containing protein [Lachnospiraceae bacterium]
MAESRKAFIEKYKYPDAVDGMSKVEKSKADWMLRELAEVTHKVGEYDRDRYLRLINEICNTYHIARGDSEFFTDIAKEKAGEGEIFCDFDNGKERVMLLRNRILTLSGAVITGTLYIEADAEPLTREDLDNLDLMICLIIAFISRMRLQKTVEKYMFADDAGYPNMRAFKRHLVSLIDEDKLGGMIAVHFDLHNFGLINQEVGRQNGDTVMRNYYDMVWHAMGNEGFLCRLGGDKFLGVLPEGSKDEVIKLFKGTSVIFDDSELKRVNISASAGLYPIPVGKPVTISDVMDKVMISSMVAKREEDESIVFFEEKMEKGREHVKQIRSRFRKALAKEEFKVYYQPKVDINTREVIGAEALCRWISDGKVVPPMDFIPVLEQNGEICELDFYMLDHVCRDIRRWLDEGKDPVRISVNFSRNHMADTDFSDQVIKIVDNNNTPHKYVEVELTETTTDVRFRDLKRLVSEFKDTDIITAVDDFGIGYSSLNMIREVPMDVLKIDRCFLPTDEDDERSTTNLMFKHVVSLVQDIGMECVVEGLETPKQLDLLKENNCRIAQGFYFDKPLPVEEFEKRLEQKVYQ